MIGFRDENRDQRGLTDETNLGRHLEYFETSAVPKIRKNKNYEQPDFDYPYDGFAMSPHITIEDASVKK